MVTKLVNDELTKMLIVLWAECIICGVILVLIYDTYFGIVSRSPRDVQIIFVR